MESIYERLYKPDVLSCLADLSNDEVFTPPDVANKMLDLLPQELFKNKETKILDPACKSGVILREAAKRFIAGERDQFNSLQECIDWIFHNQIYGIAVTELTSLLSRRSVYCSKYPNSPFSITKFPENDVQGNILFHRIQHEWTGIGEDKKCKWCGASAKTYERPYDLETHAYELIHTIKPEDIFKMQFDVICANPPYQLSDGGAKASAKPIYHLFVQQAKKLNPRFITMIIPARWYAGGKGLDLFREEMLNDGHITTLVDYADSKDCFPGVDVAGGICYFLRERDRMSECQITNHLGGKSYTSKRKLNEYDTFVRYSEAADILKKVANYKEKTMDGMVSSRKPFGLDTNVKPIDSGDLILRYSKGTGRYDRAHVPSGKELIDKWKTIISYTGYEHAGQPDADGSRRVLSIVEVLPPKTICSETYLVAGVFDNESNAINLRDYLRSKFVRFLVGLRVVSQHVTRGTFAFVPIQDFSTRWTDEILYKKYNLTDDEIEFIENLTKPMPDFKSGGNN